MAKLITITQARDSLPSIVAEAQKKSERFDITVNGKRQAVLMSADEFDAWEETNEILSDKKLMRDIRIAEKEIEEGKGIPWEEFEKELNLD